MHYPVAPAPHAPLGNLRTLVLPFSLVENFYNLVDSVDLDYPNLPLAHLGI